MILDTTVTPELAAEDWPGTSSVPCSRPDGTPDLRSSMTASTLSGDANVRAAIQAHANLIKAETLATTLELMDHSAALPSAAVGDKQQVGLALERA